jgi:CRISPR-associated protein Csb2
VGKIDSREGGTSSYFCLSFRFLHEVFHDQAGHGKPEWPPSPMRVFQSMVAAASRRNAGELPDAVQSAWEWLERQHPIVVAPAAA